MEGLLGLGKARTKNPQFGLRESRTSSGCATVRIATETSANVYKSASLLPGKQGVRVRVPPAEELWLQPSRLLEYKPYNNNCSRIRQQYRTPVEIRRPYLVSNVKCGEQSSKLLSQLAEACLFNMFFGSNILFF